MRKATLFIITILLLSFVGCTTIKPIDTSTVTYKSSELSYQEFEKSEIAILPVLAGEGWEGFRRLTGKEINSAYKTNIPGKKILSAKETLKLLNKYNLSDEYSQMMENYSRTGILNKKTLNSIGKNLNCKYLLYSKVKSNKSVDAYLLDGNISTTKINGVEIYAQLWNTEIGDIVWEGEGGSACSSKQINTTNLISLAANSLVERIAKSQNKFKPPKKVESLHLQMQLNKRMTVLGLTIGSALLAFLIVY